MIPKNFLSHEDGPNVICAQCRKYLSVPPIIIASDRPVCGRCVKTDQYSEENRAYFYETIAKYMVFPCNNDIHGCSIKLPWGEVLNHEAKCIFANIVCPVLKCRCVVKKENIIDHVKTNHGDLILNEDVVKELSDADTLQSILFQWKYYWLIFQAEIKGNISVRFSGDTLGVSVSDENLKCCRISSFDERFPEKIKVSIALSKSRSNLIAVKETRVMKYVLLPKFSSTEIIDYSSFQDRGKNCIYCKFKFDEVDVQLKDVNDKILSNLECPFCNYYMLPPIYTCNKGHNLCRDCKTRWSQCPFCSSNLHIANHCLSQFTELIVYPCRYKDEGCDFRGNVEDISRHELWCYKSHDQDNITCFTNHMVPCQWKGRYRDVYAHIKSLHTDYCLDIKYPVSIDIEDDDFVTKMGYVQYGVRVFKINLELDFERKVFWWAVTSVTNKEHCFDDYLCYLNFENEKATFSIRQLCGKKYCVGGCFNTIPLNLLLPFINHNKLTFKMNIV